jgi:hypothetical protein
MINRRHDGRASCLAQRSPKHPLEKKATDLLACYL